MNPETILEIAVPTPLRRSFDYLLPDDISLQEPGLAPGARLLVPFGRQQLVGILLSIKSESDMDVSKLKPVIGMLDSEPVFDKPLLALMQWASQYYHYPIGECFAAAQPALLRKGESLLKETTLAWRIVAGKTPTEILDELPKSAHAQRKLVDILSEHSLIMDREKKSYGVTPATIKALKEKGLIESVEETPVANRQVAVKSGKPVLNNEQQTLIDSFHQYQHQFTRILLEGVTGSGKTEVYLRLIESVLEDGKQAIVLVPEIGLTPQTLQRFEDRFDCPMAIFHSSLSDRQRLVYWQQARSGYARIIIGTRSAIFTACLEPGIIIIDEEHDLSYKQQDGLRYSARDLAIVRAHQAKIPIVLGSATPTLESLHNAETGKYVHWQLLSRAGNASIPQIAIYDIRNQPMHDGISEHVLAEMDDCLQRGEQVLVFINRRGFAPSLICHDCGWVSQCHACDARLTIHLAARHLRCHHCQSVEPIPNQCPQCQSNDLVYAGIGTERLERSLREHFGDTPLFRIDRDTTAGKRAMPDMIDSIHQAQAAILVGTQMLAKGHHFPNVTLVVVIDADGALMGTDYRSMERFGQLLIQVTGRAGREEKQGKAIIQTHYPEHLQLNKLVHFGYHRFAMDLLAERQQLHLPPFTFHALVRLEDKDANQAIQTLNDLKHAISLQACHCLGPYPASLQRRAHYFRYQLLITADNRANLRNTVAVLLDSAESIVQTHKQRWSVDIDPQDMS